MATTTLLRIWGRFRQTTLIGDFAVTMVFAVAQLLLAPVSTGLLARHLGAHDFGTFSSLQRLLLLVSPLASLGVGVGVTRYVASVRGKWDAKVFFWSAMFIALAGALMTSLLVSSVSPSLVADSPPFWIFFALLAVLTSQNLLGAWLRGNGDYLASNTMLLLAELSRLVLLIVLFISEWHPRVALLLLIIMVTQLTVDIMVVVNIRPIRFRPDLLSRSHCRTLLVYSAPRVIGGLSLQALNSVGVFYFALRENNAAAGFMALSLVILNAGSMVFSRLGSILMPHLSFELSKSGNGNEIPVSVKLQVSVVISLLLTAAAFVGAVGILGIPPFVVPWLGPEFTQAELPVAVLSSCIGVIALYSVLSGAVNAADTRALNTINLAIVLVVTGVILLVTGGLNLTQVAWVQAFGYLLLALLTVLTVCRLYRIKGHDIGAAGTVVLAVVNAAIAWITLEWSHDITARAIGVVIIVMVDCILIWRMNPPWLQVLGGRVSFLRRTGN